MSDNQKANFEYHIGDRDKIKRHLETSYKNAVEGYDTRVSKDKTMTRNDLIGVAAEEILHSMRRNMPNNGRGISLHQAFDSACRQMWSLLST